MPRDDDSRILDILDAGNRIVRATQELSFEQFASNDILIRAVLYDLAVIGEAAKGVSAGTRSQYPDVPWSEMAGMRDVVIHQYFGIDAQLVWRAAKGNLPLVLAALSRHDI